MDTRKEQDRVVLYRMNTRVVTQALIRFIQNKIDQKNMHIATHDVDYVYLSDYSPEDYDRVRSYPVSVKEAMAKDPIRTLGFAGL